jgi:hypothetical protein
MVIYILIALVVCGLFAYQIAEQKQAGNRGFWLGLFLGPAGVIAAGFVGGRSQCQKCGGRLNDAANKKYPICSHCRADFSVAGKNREPEARGSFQHLLHTD